MFKRVFSGIAIAEGGIIPKWYGISYYLPDRDAAVCYPLVLNKVVRFFRNSYWWIYFGISRVRKFSLLERIQSDSYQRGLKYGTHRGQQELLDSLDRAFKINAKEY